MSKKLVWDAVEMARKLRDMQVVDRVKTPPTLQNQRFSKITGTRLAGGGHPPPSRKNKVTLPKVWGK